MAKVFLSYSKKDHYFAELTCLKLAEKKIELWRDKEQLRAGDAWQGAIEKAISESIAVLVALTKMSAESPYVTFEWAYALGKSKAIIPLKLEVCDVHPKLAPIQHLDFSIPGALPWTALVEQIQEIQSDATSADDLKASESSFLAPQNSLAKAILAYMSSRGYQYISYDRIRKRIDPSLTDEKLNEFATKNPALFLKAVLSDNKPGLKKLLN